MKKSPELLNLSELVPCHPVCNEYGHSSECAYQRIYDERNRLLNELYAPKPGLDAAIKLVEEALGETHHDWSEDQEETADQLDKAWQLLRSQLKPKELPRRGGREDFDELLPVRV